MFVYNAVDVNKIATAFLAKPPPYINVQSFLWVISISYLIGQSLVKISR